MSPLPAEKARTAWLYASAGKDGFFRVVGGKQWREATPDGREFRFEEADRTEEYVELFDRSRSMLLRLYADHCQWQQGGNPQWHLLYAGRWVAGDALPKPLAADYRIRLAYFVPSDREPTPHYAEKIRVVMHFVSAVYRQDFTARGIRSEGLRFEEQGGQPVVHLIRGAHPAATYNNAPNYNFQSQWNQILPEIPRSIGTPQANVIIVFAETYDAGPASFEWPGGVALGGRFSTEGGVGLFSSWILRPEFCANSVDEQLKLLFDATPIEGRIALGHGGPDSPRFEFIEDGFGAVAHELGHALGLQHDNRHDQSNIMGNGFRGLRENFRPTPDAQRYARFSDDNARILYSSRYLATDLNLADFEAPTVTLSWFTPPTAGATQISVTVDAADNEGLRAIAFFCPTQDSVVGGAPLSGKQQQFVQTLNVRALPSGEFKLVAQLTDTGGNLTLAELVAAVAE